MKTDNGYKFHYNGKERVAIALEIEGDIALCWEFTVGAFRKYHISRASTPENITFTKLLKLSQAFFENSTEQEIREYYHVNNCTVFFGEEDVFIINDNYLEKMNNPDNIYAT
jgi:hypothetical protein